MAHKLLCVIVLYPIRGIIIINMYGVSTELRYLLADPEFQSL